MYVSLAIAEAGELDLHAERSYRVQIARPLICERPRSNEDDVVLADSRGT
jgi:hypothetical protein